MTNFRISGIESSAALDPTNTSAFVTAVSFDYAGGTAPQTISFTQSPIVNGLPEPAALTLALLGLAGIGFSRRQGRGNLLPRA